MKISDTIVDVKDGLHLLDPIMILCIKGGFGYNTITDEMIHYYLNSDLFIDTAKIPCTDHHNREHHALRIASIIKLIQNKVYIDAIHIFVINDEQDEIEIEDGHHRLRAYAYIKKHIDSEILMKSYVYYT